MNDRFRFRVWNKQIKKYDDSFMLFNEKDCIAIKAYKDTVIEQCTGIKDCNGKLIYEGDLIRFEMDGKIVNKGVVEWRNGDGIFSGYWEVVNHQIACSYIFTGYWEVYGNIHEMEIEK